MKRGTRDRNMRRGEGELSWEKMIARDGERDRERETRDKDMRHGEGE